MKSLHGEMQSCVADEKYAMAAEIQTEIQNVTARGSMEVLTVEPSCVAEGDYSGAENKVEAMMKNLQGEMLSLVADGNYARAAEIQTEILKL